MHDVAPKSLAFEGFTLDLMRCTLRRGDDEIPLRPKTFDVLRYLAEHPGRLVSKEEMIQAVWPGVFVTDDSLVQCVGEIRAVLDGDARQVIRTLPRRGYLFDTDVSAGEGVGLAAAPPGALVQKPKGGGSLVDLPSLPLAMGVLLVVFGGWGVWTLRQGQETSLSPTPAVLTNGATGTAPRARQSIAVLPFTNLSDDPGQEYLVDALVDDITTELSHSRGMFVIARQSAFAYKNKAMDPAAIGRELGVRNILFGSMRRDGDLSRVNVQLVDVVRGVQLWAERFEYPRADRREAQNRIVAQIAQTLGVALIMAESRRKLPEDPDAHDLAVRGHALLFTRIAVDTTEQARLLFEAALALDGESVPALIGLARAHVNLVLNGWAPRGEIPRWLARAEEALGRAIEIDQTNATARSLRGTLLRARGEPEQAVAAFEYALTLNPNLARAHAEIGRVKMDVGLAAETIGHIEEAMRLSPRDRDLSAWWFWAGQAALYIGDDEAAVGWLRRAIEANPGYLNPVPFLVVAYARLGRKAEARELMDEFLRKRPKFTISGWDSAYPRRNLETLAQRERLRDTLRQFGVPEGEPSMTSAQP